MQVLANEYARMRDGVRLAADVYLPEGTGPWPVVIERTPYGKTLHSRSEVTAAGHLISRAEMAEAFTARGMVVVFQDCRGRYDSEGTFEKYVNEAADGFDTYAWIVEQPWCNGKIGSMGLSYAAHTQLAAAGLNPPGLATMVLDSGGFDNAYRWGIRQGGAFELKQCTWAYKQSRSKAEFSEAELREWFTRMPWSEGNSPLVPGSSFEEYVLSQWRHGVFDEYWQQPGMFNEPFYADIPKIPIAFMCSWFDVYVPSTLHNFAALEGRQLIMGPWLHGDRNITHSGDLEFGPQASFDGNVAQSWLDYRLDWFSQVLIAGEEPPRRAIIFEMGGGSEEHGGRWVESESWPPAAAAEQEFFLAAGNALQKQPPAAGAEVILQADPAHPVPMIGGQATSGKPIFVGGGFDQVEDVRFFGTSGDGRALIARDDVLYFETEPLEQDLVLAGPVELQLRFIADGPDFDIAAKLVDVYPDGRAFNITDSILRARYRHSFSAPEATVPGQEDHLTVQLPDTCNRFAAGHRLRVMLAGANFPHFDVNPNSGEAEGYATQPRIAHTRILLGQSRLKVWVVNPQLPEQ